LTQYTLAAERGNRSVATLSDGLDPTVLALVAEVCRGVPDGVDVAVCGDLASDAAAATLLVGLGVRELSVTAPAVPIVKAGLRATDLAGAERLATRALSLSSAAEVRAMLGST
ncbi:MAG: putative PEP-binding protein, partial [Nocardioidaceae bacterium]